MTILSKKTNDIVTMPVKNIDYHCVINNISKFEVIDLLKNSVIENLGYL